MGNTRNIGETPSPNAYIFSDDSIRTGANTIAYGNSRPGDDAPIAAQYSPN